MERLLFNDLVATSRDLGLQEIIGWYKPTARNGLVKDHYAGLGFARDGGTTDAERWHLAVGPAEPLTTFIGVPAGAEQEVP